MLITLWGWFILSAVFSYSNKLSYISRLLHARNRNHTWHHRLCNPQDTLNLQQLVSAVWGAPVRVCWLVLQYGSGNPPVYTAVEVQWRFWTVQLHVYHIPVFWDFCACIVLTLCWYTLTVNLRGLFKAVSQLYFSLIQFRQKSPLRINLIYTHFLISSNSKHIWKETTH